MKNLLLIIVGVVALHSCTHQLPPDVEYYNLKGNVKTITVCEYEGEELFGEIKKTKSLQLPYIPLEARNEFNKSGLFTYQEFIYLSDTITSVYKYQDGKIIATRHRNEGAPIEVITYYAIDDRRLVAYTLNDEGDTINKSSSTLVNGRATRFTSTNPTGETLTTIITRTDKAHIRTTYKSDGKTIFNKEAIGRDTIIEFNKHRKAAFDNHGNVQWALRTPVDSWGYIRDDDSYLLDTTFYSYILDNKGNWIERYQWEINVFDGSKESIKVTTRDITYW